MEQGGVECCRKEKHLWNISVTKEARMDPKVVLESLRNAFIGESFFASEKKLSKQRHILQNDTSSSLIGYKTGRAH